MNVAIYWHNVFVHQTFIFTLFMSSRPSRLLLIRVWFPLNFCKTGICKRLNLEQRRFHGFFRIGQCVCMCCMYVYCFNIWISVYMQQLFLVEFWVDYATLWWLAYSSEFGFFCLRTFQQILRIGWDFETCLFVHHPSILCILLLGLKPSGKWKNASVPFNKFHCL